MFSLQKRVRMCLNNIYCLLSSLYFQFHNMAWECTFGKDVNPTPEDCLKLFMDEPAVDPQVLPPRPVGQPWLPDEILADVDDLLENAESANELLG